MTRLSVFNSPLLLGFDHVERVLDRVAKSSAEGYPPYNIEQTSEHCLRITLAVAGFHEEELSVSTEDNQLVIRGRQSADDGSRVFLHRGIASRQFQRSFVLAEGIEVAALTRLDTELAALPADASAEDIQNIVYAIGKESGFENLRDWFKACYETLLGSSAGPRMGSFIALYGIENSRRLIAEALA